MIVELALHVQPANNLKNLLAIFVLAGLGVGNVRHEVANVFVAGITYATQDVDCLVATVPCRKDKFTRLVVSSQKIAALNVVGYLDTGQLQRTSSDIDVLD